MNPLIAHICQQLSPIYDQQEAKEIAFWILEERFQLSRTDILLGQPPDCLDEIEEIIQRLLQHEPLQYILGYTDWRGLRLEVNSNTLIPRPETAELVDWILEKENASFKTVLDIGTGTGCIAISLKKDRPDWQVTALDIDPDTLNVARRNAANHQIAMNIINLDILHSNHLEEYDIVVSNPPYVMECEKAGMRNNVLLFEPSKALFVPDDDPTLFYREIANQRIGRHLYFEVNEALAHEVGQVMQNSGYTDIVIKQDIYGKERMVFGRRI